MSQLLTLGPGLGPDTCVHMELEWNGLTGPSEPQLAPQGTWTPTSAGPQRLPGDTALTVSGVPIRTGEVCLPKRAAEHIPDAACCGAQWDWMSLS